MIPGARLTSTVSDLLTCFFSRLALYLGRESFSESSTVRHGFVPKIGLERNVPSLTSSRWLSYWLDVCHLCGRDGTFSTSSRVRSNKTAIYGTSSAFPFVCSRPGHRSLHSRSRFYRHKGLHPCRLLGFSDRRSTTDHHKGQIQGCPSFRACWRSSEGRKEGV